MTKKGRHQYVATVNGEVDGVPFTNWFKYLTTAKRNTMDNRNYVLTVLETGHKYSWNPARCVFTALTFNAPELPNE